MKRRHFLNQLPLLSAIPVIGRQPLGKQTTSLLESLIEAAKVQPNGEVDWDEVRASFNISTEYLDFNSAGLSQVTKNVLEEYLSQLKEFNEIPSRKSNDLRNVKNLLLRELAKMVNCDVDEVILQRNATEALSVAIFGIPLQRDDEVIVGKYDYPHMHYAWKQRPNEMELN